MAHDTKQAAAAKPAAVHKQKIHKTVTPVNAASLKLPLLVASPSDISRLQRELEAIDDQLLQSKLRSNDDKLPLTSHLLDQLVKLNNLQLLQPADRQKLLNFLAFTREKAPVLHMSFSADPSPAFTEKLMSWLRQEIHPNVLLTIGLQPNIGAGCIVRSTNKYFDFSLRKDFYAKRELLLQKVAAKVAA